VRRWHGTCIDETVGKRAPTVAVTQSLELTPQLAMRPSPTLLAFVEMLALPAVELDELVERELAENPALERADAHREWKEPTGRRGAFVPP
jgi:DNA-directed RNA polymerase specialized sigma54-like protein